MPEFAAAALPTADGTAVVLDADQIWHKLRAALEPQGERGGFRLRPLVVRERSAPVPLDVAVEQTAPPAASEPSPANIVQPGYPQISPAPPAAPTSVGIL